MSDLKVKTLARSANEELIAESDNSPLLVTPFATRKYKLTSVHLQTTREELNILKSTAAIVRPGFIQNDKDKEIQVPTFFAKVDGIPENSKEYWKNIRDIETDEGLSVLMKDHFSDGEWQLPKDDEDKIFEDMSVENLMKSKSWAYTILNRDLQKKIATAIVQLFTEWPFIVDLDEETRYTALRICLDMPREIMEMTLEVDYPKEVPLMAFLHDDSTGSLDFEDVVALNILHYLGWDIQLFAPSGFASIENYMNEDYYDIFFYEKMKTTEMATSQTKKSFFEKLFNR